MLFILSSFVDNTKSEDLCLFTWKSLWWIIKQFYCSSSDEEISEDENEDEGEDGFYSDNFEHQVNYYESYNTSISS